MEKIRAHIVVSGRVQGVFFRAHTREEALKRHVSGWVRNRSDGKVEAVLEGRKEEVESLIAWCQIGPPQALVTQTQVTWEEYREEFSGFSITSSTRQK